MKYFKKIVGKTVYLSPISVEDAETFVEWMNDFGITDFTGRSANIVTLENEKEWLAEATSGKKHIFAIVSLEDDRVLGTVELMDIREFDRCATAGIFIGENNDRSRGIGTEALSLLVEFGFLYMNLHSINLAVLADNPRAIKCYTKVGFKECGRMREARFVGGKYRDLIHMDLLASEYEAKFITNRNL